jgi:hypothetical protein
MTMAFRHVLCLYLALALAWCEEALSFSSLSSRGTMTLPSMSSLSTKHSSGMGMMRLQLSSLESPTSIVATTSTGPRLQRTRMTMASDDSSSEQEVTKKNEQGNGASNSKRNNAILVLPLFCKFIVVILIKFLTDLVVFPSLFLYRLARRAKRKMIGWFGKIHFGVSPSSVKPNGE